MDPRGMAIPSLTFVMLGVLSQKQVSPTATKPVADMPWNSDWFSFLDPEISWFMKQSPYNIIYPPVN